MSEKINAVVRVENHQPVPLVPLAELSWGEGDVMYIGRRVMREGSEYDDGEEDVGWVVMDSSYYGMDGYPFLVAGRYAFPNFDHYDSEKTLARKLQPGERLVITYAG